MTQPPPLPAFNPYAAPSARVDDTLVDQLELAARLTRLGAAILDGLVFAVPMILLIVGVGAAVGSAGKTQAAGLASGVVGPLALLAFVLLGALVVINMVLLHRHGQTLGKRWLGIKVVLVDGGRCGLTRYIFARWLPTAVLSGIPLVGGLFWLLDMLLIFNSEQRCLHDLIAGTIVVKA